MDVDVFVRTRQLRILLEDSRERMENFPSIAKKIPIKSWEIESDEGLETEYLWTVNVSSFIGERLQALSDRVQSLETAINRASSPAAAPGGIHFNVDPSHRGAAETSDTRARLWISQQNQGHPTGRAALPAGLVSHGALSSIGTYKITFATLAAISFVGASVAWGAVFCGARGDLVILAWASSAFITGSVAAGSMGIIVESDKINFDRDMGARRATRAFAITSAIMTFVGIVLLGIATANVDPSHAVTAVGDTASRRRGMQAAGWFIVVVAAIEVTLAVTVRIMYHSGPWRL